MRLVTVASVVALLAFVNGASATSAPRRIWPQAFSAINRSTWWVLAEQACGNRPPCRPLVRTTDYGRTFSSVPTPASTFSGVAFANPDDGYLVDQAGGIWITRDGGVRWRYTTLDGIAEQVVAGRHYVYATVVTADARLLLMRSTVGHGRWRTLTAAGDRVYGVSLRGHHLLVSTDAPASTDTPASSDATTTPPVPLASSSGELLSSTDGGATFRPLPEPSGVTGGCRPEQPTRRTVWLLCAGAEGDWRSTDAGASYTPLQLPSGVGWLNAVDFFDGQHGLALGGPGEYSPTVNLYRTSDGGATYRVVTVRCVCGTALARMALTAGASGARGVRAPNGLPYSTASNAVVQHQPAPGTCHSRGRGVYALPDPRCTPGALNRSVTQATIGRTICRSGWTASVRPPESITEREKYASMAAYGYTGSASNFEYDHFVPLELGGATNDTRNLWPEPGASPNRKDRVENYLKSEVCDRRLTLARAQRLIVTNWVRIYRRIAGSTPTSPPRVGATTGHCSAAAVWNDRYHDYDVYVHSSEPDTRVTVTGAGTRAEYTTNSSGSADVYFHAGQAAAGTRISVTVGPAACSATL